MPAETRRHPYPCSVDPGLTHSQAPCSGHHAPAPIGSRPHPVPITPADAVPVAAFALLAAADELRGHAVGIRDGHDLPPELRPSDNVMTPGTLHAVAAWLDARAGLYGFEPSVETVTPVGDFL